MVNFTPLLPAEDGDVIGDHRDLRGTNDVDGATDEENSRGYAEQGGRDYVDSALENEEYDEDVEYLDPESSYKSLYQEAYRYPDKTNIAYEVDSSKLPDTGSRLRRSIYYEDDPSRYSVRTRYANSSIDANRNKCLLNNHSRNNYQTPPYNPCRPQSPHTKPEQISIFPSPKIPISRAQYRRDDSRALASQMQQMAEKRGVDLRGTTKEEALETAHESSLQNPEDTNRNLRNQNANQAADGEEYPTGVMKKPMSPPASRSGPSPTGRGPSASSPSRCSSPARPRSSLPPVPTPPSSVLCRSGEESDPSPKRQLFLKYSYIPAWVFLARRNHKFFLQILDYYFGHADWPDFDKLPENFRTLCYRNDIRRNHAKKMPGFAPVWMFLLRRLDERYFMAAVDHFFEQRMFPNWDWLPENFVQKFQELGLNERQYYA